MVSTLPLVHAGGGGILIFEARCPATTKFPRRRTFQFLVINVAKECREHDSHGDFSRWASPGWLIIDDQWEKGFACKLVMQSIAENFISKVSIRTIIAWNERGFFFLFINSIFKIKNKFGQMILKEKVKTQIA